VRKSNTNFRLDLFAQKSGVDVYEQSCRPEKCPEVRNETFLRSYVTKTESARISCGSNLNCFKAFAESDPTKKVSANRFSTCAQTPLKHILTSSDSSEVIAVFSENSNFTHTCPRKCLTFRNTSDLDVSAKTEDHPRKDSLIFNHQ
jgi:hypothetical protein